MKTLQLFTSHIFLLNAINAESVSRPYIHESVAIRNFLREGQEIQELEDILSERESNQKNFITPTLSYLQSDIAKTIEFSPLSSLSSSSSDASLSETIKLGNEDDPRCPFAFTLGYVHSTLFHDESDEDKDDVDESSMNEFGISKQPLIMEVQQPYKESYLNNQKDIWFTTRFEHLDKFTTTNHQRKSSSTQYYKEDTSREVEEEQFPMLFESSTFHHTQPIKFDVNADGKEDIILVESSKHGRIFFVDGYSQTLITNIPKTGGRYVSKDSLLSLKIPHLYLRANWLSEVKESIFENSSSDQKYMNPFHFYFQSSFLQGYDKDKELISKQKGIPADILHQNVLQRDQRKEALEKDERKSRQTLIKARDSPKRNLSLNDESTLFEGESVKKDSYNDEEVERVAALLTVEKTLEDIVEDQEAEKVAALLTVEKTLEDMIEDQEAEKVAALLTVEKTLEDMIEDQEAEKVAALLTVESILLEEQNHDKTTLTEQLNESPKTSENDLVSFDEENIDAFFKNDLEHIVNDDSEEDDMHYNDDATTFDMDDAATRIIPDHGESFMVDDLHMMMYDDYPMPHDDIYGDPLFDAYNDPKNYVAIDSHVLATPAVTEIGVRVYGQSVSEVLSPMLVIPVSYFMDEREYSVIEENHPDENLNSIEKRQNYAASALMVYNLKEQRFAGNTLLDLSTRSGNNSHNDIGAYIKTSPTICNLDGKIGEEDENVLAKINMDVIVGTSLGMVYALDVEFLQIRRGFPVQLPAPIHSQIMAVDLLGDSKLEILAIDIRGNLACIDSNGKTLWAVSLEQEDRGEIMTAGGLAVGDVDGNGILDVVLVLYKRPSNKFKFPMIEVHAVESQNGQSLKYFPISIKATAPISHAVPEPPLLLDLHSSQSHWMDQLRKKVKIDKESVERINGLAAAGISKTAPKHGGLGRGLHIITQSPDGFLHFIEGGTGCVNKIAIGESILATPLADELHSNGKMGLVVATSKTGKILTLETPSVNHHVLNTYRGGDALSNSGTRVQGYSSKQGILLSDSSSQVRYVTGLRFPISFEVFDVRENIDTNNEQAFYLVDIRVGSNPEHIIFRQIYHAPGEYTEKIWIPYGPSYYNLIVSLTNENGVKFEQNVKIGYNVHFYEGLNWFISLPLVLCAIPLLLYKKNDRNKGVDRTSYL